MAPYVGFWRRLYASFLDTLLLIIVSAPVVTAIYGRALLDTTRSNNPIELLLFLVVTSCLLLGFWIVRHASPGKIFLQARIVDADTGQAPSLKQWFTRYMGYFVSSLAVGMGFLWIAIDSRKQGWHDKLANTIVIQSD